jgi:hypothetical protein
MYWDRDPNPPPRWGDRLLCVACSAVAFYCLFEVFRHVP